MKETNHLYPLADPQRSYFEGDLLQNAELNTSNYSITIHLLDSRGEKCRGAQKVESSLRCIRDDFVIIGDLKPKSADFACFAIEFKPQRQGRHVLDVKANGIHIHQSPYSLFIRKPFQQTTHLVSTISCLQYPVGLVVENGNVIATEQNRSRLLMIDHDSEFHQHERCSLQLKPSRITVDDKTSSLYITSTIEHKVYKLKNDGKIVSSVGKQGSGEKEFDSPFGIQISKRDELYVCDRNNNRIQVFDLDLSYKRLLGYATRDRTEIPHFSFPSDIAFDADGNIYVADYRNNRIQVFTPDEHISYTISNISGPVGLRIHNNLIFVVVGVSVLLYSLSGKRCGTICEGILQPQDIAIDQDGFVYVTSHNSSIYVY